mgnify:CR=1 FL=1
MDVKEAIRNRRSYRSLAKTEITAGLINDLAESASLAASCYNNQPWRYVFVYQEEQLTKLHEALAGANSWAQDAPLIVGIFTKEDYDCVVEDRKYYLFDVGMSVNNMVLRATELGLVTHLMAGFDEQKAKEILEIPAEMELISLMAVGERADEINPDLSPEMKQGEKQRPPRLDLEEFIYHNSVD